MITQVVVYSPKYTCVASPLNKSAYCGCNKKITYNAKKGIFYGSHTAEFFWKKDKDAVLIGAVNVGFCLLDKLKK